MADHTHCNAVAFSLKSRVAVVQRHRNTRRAGLNAERHRDMRRGQG